MRATLQVCMTARVEMRTNDKAGRWIKGDEGTVHQLGDGSNFTNGHHVDIMLDSSSSSIKVVPEEFVDETKNQIKQFPFIGSYGTTATRSQSRQKLKWNILLTKVFRGKLTFAFAQFYVMISRGQLPPLIQVASGQIREPDEVFDKILLADPETVRFVKVYLRYYSILITSVVERVTTTCG